MSQVNLVGIASVATPPTGEAAVYIDSATKTLKSKNDVGAVTDYSAAGNSITSLTGEVTAAGPGAAAATVSNTAVLSKVLTGLSPVSGDLSATDTLLIAFNKLAARLNAAWFPEATDGDVVISSDTALTRDMYYNTLVVNSGVNLFTAGYRILAKVSIENNGTIHRAGNNAVGITAGAALAAGALGSSGAGGAGGTAAGTAGGATVASLGGAGAAGGLGSGGAGGAGGGVTLVAATSGGLEVLQMARQATIARDLGNIVINGAAGGGGGGGDGTAGGGGGSGGGVLVAIARNIFGTGIFTAMGGNGGTPVAGNRGGGGGGGGGVVALVSENDTTATSLTVTVAGGLGSSGTGSGVVGSNGSIGRIYRVRV